MRLLPCLMAFMAIPAIVLAAPGNRVNACGFSWNNNIYILGGSSDNTSSPFSYTTAPLTTTMIQWKDMPSPPQTYYFNNTCVVTPGGILVVLTIQTGNGLATFDLNAGQWTYTTTTGMTNTQFFSQIQGHVVTLVEQRYIFLYGGYLGTIAQPNNQAYLLDTTNWTWTTLGMTGGPSSSILDAGCNALKDKVFIFGGRDLTLNPVYQTIWSYNITSSTWHLEESQMVYPFTNMGVVNYRNERLWIMPGLHSGTIPESRLSYFDLANNNLTMLTATDNTAPTARYQHAVFGLGDMLLVYGGAETLIYTAALQDGLRAYNMNTQSWTIQVTAMTGTSSIDNVSTTTLSPSATSATTGTGLPTGTSSTQPAIVAGVVGGSAAIIGAVALFIWRRHVATRKRLLHFLPPKSDINELPRIRRIV